MFGHGEHIKRRNAGDGVVRRKQIQVAGKGCGVAGNVDQVAPRQGVEGGNDGGIQPFAGRVEDDDGRDGGCLQLRKNLG